MPETACNAIAVVGIDIGKNSLHIVGQDEGGAIVLRQKWSPGDGVYGLPGLIYTLKRAGPASPI